MFVSFLLVSFFAPRSVTLTNPDQRRWRRRRLDKAIFDSTDFRRSAVILDDVATENLAQKYHHTPRPPTMIERHVAGGQQRSFAGGVPPQAYGGYGQPYYPPQSMQRGYYPQQPERSLHPPGGYNQMYAGGGYGPQVAPPPPRTPTPLHQQANPPSRTQTPLHQPDAMSLPNPFGAHSPSTMPPPDGIAGDAIAPPGAAMTREGRHSGGEETPTYG